MCNLSEGIYEEGVRRGFGEGIEIGRGEGMEKGMVKGIEKTRIDNIISLMKNMRLTMDQALQALDIPEAERKAYAEKIGELQTV